MSEKRKPLSRNQNFIDFIEEYGVAYVEDPQKVMYSKFKVMIRECDPGLQEIILEKIVHSVIYGFFLVLLELVNYYYLPHPEGIQLQDEGVVLLSTILCVLLTKRLLNSGNESDVYLELLGDGGAQVDPIQSEDLIRLGLAGYSKKEFKKEVNKALKQIRTQKKKRNSTP
jgi:hypothetical protein